MALHRRISLLLLATLPTSCLSADVLFSAGRTDWRIAVSIQASQTELYAAKELAKVLRKVSGAHFPIVETATSLPRAIHIGTPGSMDGIRDANLGLDQSNEQSAAVHARDNRLYLAGTDPRGALYAVYLFLQRELGVRWLWPGDEGEFVPSMSEYVLPPTLAMCFTPPIKYRGYHGLHGPSRQTEIWLGRNFGNIVRNSVAGGKKQIAERKRRGFYIYRSGHNVMLSDGEHFRSHPEYFSEHTGKRIGDQLCWNSDGAEEAIFRKLCSQVDEFPDTEMLGLYPADNRHYCQCGICRESTVSDNWFGFYQRIRKRLKKRYPDLKTTTIAYQGYVDVPKSVPTDTEFVEYAFYDRCYVHTMAQCGVNRASSSRIGKWANSGCGVGIYGYAFDMFKPSRMVPMYETIADEMKYFRTCGVAAVLPEIPVYGYPSRERPERRIASQMRLAWYLYLQLLFDPDQDWQELIHDWSLKVYPASAEAMTEYHTLLARRWSQMKNHLSVYHLPPDPVVGDFIDRNTVTAVDELFRQADTGLASIRDPEELERQTGEIAFEKALWNQWTQAYYRRLENTVTLPNSTTVAGASRYIFWEDRATSIAGSWVAEGLQLEFCVDALQADLKATYSVKGGTGTEHKDTVIIHPGRPTRVAVPSTALGGPVSTDSDYVLRLQVEGKDALLALLCPNERPRIRQRILFSLPCGEEQLKYYPNLRSSLLEAGWQADFTTDVPTFCERPLSAYDVVAIAMNGSHVPPAYLQSKLKAFMDRGGLAILGGDHIDTAALFGNSQMALAPSGKQAMQDRLRKTQWFAPGNWSEKPDDLRKALQTYCTPLHGYGIPAGSEWKPLATMRRKGGGTCPYLLWMPVGRGRLVVASGSLGLQHYLKWVIFGCSYPDSTTRLLNNMLRFHREGRPEQ